MHLIVDIRAKHPEDMIRVRYAENWVHLWREHFPHDTHTFLVFDKQLAPEGERIFVAKQNGWLPTRRRLSLRGSNEIFRSINFSQYAPYDPSIPTTSHIFDMGEWFYDSNANANIWQRKTREYSIRKYLRDSSHIIVPNFLTGSELVELWGTEESKIDILPYLSLAPIQPDDHILTRLHIAPPYFIHDSSTGNESNIHSLLRWFSQYRKNGWKAILVIHGNTEHHLKSITEIIRLENIQDMVRITGCLDIHEQESLYTHASWWIAIGAYSTARLALALALSKNIPLLLSHISAFDHFQIPKIHPNHLDELTIALARLESNGEALIPKKDIISNEQILAEYKRILSQWHQESLQKEIFSI